MLQLTTKTKKKKTKYYVLIIDMQEFLLKFKI